MVDPSAREIEKYVRPAAAGGSQEDAAPTWLLDAIATVLKDMQLRRPLQLNIGYRREDAGSPRGLVVFEDTDRRAFGFGVSDSPATVLLELAEGLQENLPELESTWALALPPCPGHQHPARPIKHDGRAWWTCPLSGALLSPIGHFQVPPAS
jgi:hypothetical protein